MIFEVFFSEIGIKFGETVVFKYNNKPIFLFKLIFLKLKTYEVVNNKFDIF